jgi:hypothetical protein
MTKRIAGRSVHLQCQCRAQCEILLHLFVLRDIRLDLIWSSNFTTKDRGKGICELTAFSASHQRPVGPLGDHYLPFGAMADEGRIHHSQMEDLVEAHTQAFATQMV